MQPSHYREGCVIICGYLWDTQYDAAEAGFNPLDPGNWPISGFAGISRKLYQILIDNHSQNIVLYVKGAKFTTINCGTMVFIFDGSTMHVLHV